MTYSFLPHMGGFNAETVIKPAYMANYRPLVRAGEYTLPSLLTIDAGNVIIETIKPCEDGGNAFIARLYEAEGTFANTVLHTGFDVKKAELTNMLEESQEELACENGIALTFRPFEIKTIKLSY